MYLSKGVETVNAMIGEPFRNIWVPGCGCSGSGIQIDVNPLLPLVLQAAGEQLAVEGQESVLILRPAIHFTARQPIIFDPQVV